LNPPSLCTSSGSRDSESCTGLLREHLGNISGRAILKSDRNADLPSPVDWPAIKHFSTPCDALLEGVATVRSTDPRCSGLRGCHLHCRRHHSGNWALGKSFAHEAAQDRDEMLKTSQARMVMKKCELHAGRYPDASFRQLNPVAVDRVYLGKTGRRVWETPIILDRSRRGRCEPP